MKALHFVTSNKGKCQEVEARIKPLGYELYQLKVDYPEVQADTLDEVVFYGIQYLEEEIKGGFVIEDSGLFVEPLGGFPGVYSAYVQRTIGNQGILDLLAEQEERNALFRSCFGLLVPPNPPKVVMGECKGSISFAARGKEGFGYDPIFIPEGEERTFAQMSTVEKNSMSHRGRALDSLLKILER